MELAASDVKKKNSDFEFSHRQGNVRREKRLTKYNIMQAPGNGQLMK